MEDASISSLSILLFILILCSAFFSSSETGMMSLNRYRLKHLAKNNHLGARKAAKLLDRPDRLIGLILIGNNFVNILASAIATVIAVRIWGDAGIAIATGALTLVVLIFAEVTPKTLAAMYPEKVAFPASYVLVLLLKVFYPLVFAVNLITNGIFRLLGIKTTGEDAHNLSTEELRTIVNESGALIPQSNQSMLLGVLELGEVTVNDIIIPRNEVEGIDLDHEMDQILEQLSKTKHTRLPVYRGDINQIVGVLHMRNLAQLIQQGKVTKPAIMAVVHEAYFIPESTPLQTQLLNFQKESRRIGVVVDEYGDVQGIVTLEDILEEIVGELSNDQSDIHEDIHQQEDGSYFIDGSAYIREINKALNWELSTEGPKTLNGLITEQLESIPDANVCIELNEYRLETLQISDNLIKTVRVQRLEIESDEEE
ncbi:MULTISPECIES: HlyC/CorC family transporter [unclassified Marinobacterium]|uniref:HlyC/CorC family transporter n=1 Tax=unclassified Marinobacterium TaxID=2644139 RepID=UPI001567D8EE|nr:MULTISPECIES: HlyC/CorC family transporter [unclassified Marinobacterium]NRP09132.1 Magnesium and cobalt efflux protein CorC [Marinobacterium sp. xm-g-48]NRP15464.1 Magnesium and cobalt efflux protein CorC [Marinobacterium sp. xm-a-152]NRP26446.1 Magnesium and cobalt efflux protein CorC [Marinobacterium sp. xm-d-420]NRP35771.1 Magnesium and cobalt efflux protein CorC [Marinobacterium sp. xm-d-579]NRP37456.1 Magnesium and cobalt efflux protein CorC [Marinobacterium sp. xm-a-121]